MFELFQKIFIGHVHKWKEREVLHVHKRLIRELPQNKIYILECEHCGELKKFSVY